MPHSELRRVSLGASARRTPRRVPWRNTKLPPSMALGEYLTISIGLSAVRAVVKSWVGDTEIAVATADDVSELLKTAGLDFFERRRLARELDEVTERVADRLEPFFAAEQFGGLSTSDKMAAAGAVSSTVNRGFTDPAIVIAENLDPEALMGRLLLADPDRPQQDLLSELSTRLYRIALSETCAYIVAMTERLPNFAGRANAELLSRTGATLELLDEALSRLPESRADQAESFRTHYIRAVVRQLQRVGLEGFGGEEQTRRYDLSVAYISLSVTPVGEHEESERDDRSPTQDSDAGITSELPPVPVQVESAVAGSTRLLIRGDAGSGKTTLLQWLALNASRSSFRDELARLAGLIPFFVPLRHYTDERLPVPCQFVDRVALTVKGMMPDGWVEEVLDKGDALVLIDGVDELSESRRDEVREWLAELTAAFPKSRYVVTSRPPAVGEDWLEYLDFDSCFLEPMSMSDIDAFVDHWHSAILLGADPDRVAMAEGKAEKLKRDIRRQPPLRRLATAPLLCAMLCSLHHDGGADLPQDRIELYDRALEALLQRRDSARHVTANQVPLSLRKRQQVLQDLAYWLVRNGYAYAPREPALAQVALSLSRVAPELHPAEAFDSLMLRTGLLREPIPEHYDFVHRTFLEYLAARAFIAVGDLGLLVSNAHADAYQEVVVLAAGVGNRQETRGLIEGLLARADDDPSVRNKLRLLAIASLETVVEIDQDLVDRLQLVIAELAPPQSLAAASDLASAGDLAVPMLGPTEGRTMRAREARACVRALGEIGTEAALDQLTRFASDERVTVTRELIDQRVSFDTVEYATRVLSHSRLDDGSIRLGLDELALAPMLPGLRSLSIVGGRGHVLDLLHLKYTPQLQSLQLLRVDDLYSLTELAVLPHLEALDVRSRSLHSAVVPVSQFPALRHLTLRSSALSDFRLIERQAKITSLEIVGPRSIPIGDIALHQNLETLVLDGSFFDRLEELANIPSLRNLSLSGADVIDLFALVHVDGLVSLKLEQVDVLRCAPLGRERSPLEQLEIVFSGSPNVVGFETLGHVTSLALWHPPPSVLEALGNLHVEELTIRASDPVVVPRAPRGLRRLEGEVTFASGRVSGTPRDHVA